MIKLKNVFTRAIYCILSFNTMKKNFCVRGTLTKCQKSARYHIDRANSTIFTSPDDSSWMKQAVVEIFLKTLYSTEKDSLLNKRSEIFSKCRESTLGGDRKPRAPRTRKHARANKQYQTVNACNEQTNFFQLSEDCL